MRMRQELAGTPEATILIAGCHTYISLNFVLSSAATLSVTSHADVQLPQNKTTVVFICEGQW